VIRLVADMTQTAEEFAFSTMFDFVQRSLQPLPDLKCWISTEDKTGADSLIGASVPVFALGPSPYATHTKEHLLVLPQQLEPFAANLVLLTSQTAGKSAPANSGSSAPITTTTAAVSAATDTNTDHTGTDTDIDADTDVDTGDSSASGETVGEADAEQFIYRWVGRVGEAALVLFIEQIERIPRLSQAGVAQLIADVEYLNNVLAVLGVALDDRLLLILQTLRAPPSPLLPDDPTLLSQRPPIVQSLCKKMSADPLA
jgi:Golgi complex component 7 (COG7)